MRQSDKALQWCRSKREEILSEIKTLQSGRLKISEDVGSGMVDITKRWIATRQRQADDLERIIAERENENR